MKTAGIKNGFGAGLVATGLMSLFMWTAQKRGHTGHLPPRKIVEAGLKAAGVQSPEKPLVKTLSTLAHFGFGGGSGAIYGLAAEKGHFSGALSGSAFGFIVWIISYKGWIPALGILRPPEEDRKGRAVTMVLAHLIYGASLGALAKPAKRW